MQIVSTAFDTAAKSSVIYPVTKAVLQTVDGTIYNLTGDKDIASGYPAVDSSCFDDGIQIGSVISANCSISLKNEDGRWNDIDLDGATLIPYSGFVLADQTKEYDKLGTFVIDDPGRPYDQLTLEASDRMILLDEDFADAGVTYPATNLQILQAISAYTGVTLASSITGIANASYSVTAAPTDSLTCRDVVGYIAMMAAGFAKTNRDGELEIVQFPALVADDTINGVSFDAYLIDGTGDEFEIGGADFTAAFGYQGATYDMPLGSKFDFKQTSDQIIVSGVSYTYYANDVEQIMMYGADNYLIEIPECPLLTHDIDTVISGIYDVVAGLTYTAFETDYPGNPALDPSDAVKLTTKDGKEIVSLISSHTFNHGGRSTMSATALAQTAKKYKSKTSRIISNLNTAIAGAVKQGQKYYGVSTSRESGIEVTGGSALNGIKALFNSDNMGWFDSGGNFIGGMTLINSLVTFIAGTLSNGVDADFYTKTGDVVIDGNTYTGILGFLKSFSETTPIFSLTTRYVTASGLKYTILECMGVRIWLMNYGTTNSTGTVLSSIGGTTIYQSATPTDAMAYVSCTDGAKQRIVMARKTGAYMDSGSGNQIGVDDTGVYKIINSGSKVYL